MFFILPTTNASGFPGAIGVRSMFPQQFLVYQLPNELQPEREITKRRTWSPFEALDLLYVFPENLCDVWSLWKDRAIRV